MSNEKGLAKILIVDDEEAIRDIFAEILMQTGLYEVESAWDGYEAVQKSAQGNFELIVMDVAMPGMDGLNTVKTLEITCPGVPILIVSGYATNEMIEESLMHGAVMALSKPVEPITLISTVGSILESTARCA